MPSSGRKADEQGPQEPLVDEASTNLSSTVTEKSTGPPATDKTGSEKANGSATHDKGKKTRGEPPFTKQEKVEMEALLDELCGHLGQPWIGGFSCYCWRSRIIRFIQSFIQPGSWKAKMSRTTSCLILIGCYHYLYMTSIEDSVFYCHAWSHGFLPPTSCNHVLIAYSNIN